MKHGTKVIIKETEQEAVVVWWKYKLVGFKFVKCYQVMYQLEDKKMHTVGFLHPNNLMEI